MQVELGEREGTVISFPPFPVEAMIVAGSRIRIVVVNADRSAHQWLYRDDRYDSGKRYEVRITHVTIRRRNSQLPGEKRGTRGRQYQRSGATWRYTGKPGRYHPRPRRARFVRYRGA